MQLELNLFPNSPKIYLLMKKMEKMSGLPQIIILFNKYITCYAFSIVKFSRVLSKAIAFQSRYMYNSKGRSFLKGPGKDFSHSAHLFSQIFLGEMNLKYVEYPRNEQQNWKLAAVCAGPFGEKSKI